MTSATSIFFNSTGDKVVFDSYPHEFKKISDDVASWRWDAALNPVVVIDPKLIKNTKRLSVEDQEKYWLDSFFGLLPHEYNEANITLKLLRGEIEEVQSLFPKWNIRDIDKKWFTSHIGMANVMVESVIGLDVTAWGSSPYENELIAAQSVAHEAVISDAVEAYYRWI